MGRSGFNGLAYFAKVRRLLALAIVGILCGSAASEEPASKQVPISIDTVLRLAEFQNPQVAIARVQVDEACAARAVADNAWLPNLTAGPSYYRHEGGISDFSGDLVRSSWGNLFAGIEINGRLDLREAIFQKLNAERALWQQRGDYQRVTSETLVEAAGTYIDLLSAKTGEAIAQSMETDLEELHKRVLRSADAKTGEPGLRVEVARIEAQLKARRLARLELRQQSNRAATKLIYLLGLDPSSTLVPMDERLVPFELVDAGPAVNELVNQALTTGPGVREMESILAVAHESEGVSRGSLKYMPVLELHVNEGGFGTGPGSRSDWDNRFDAGLTAKWSITDFFTCRDKQRVLDAKTAQAHLAFQDLRAKLTAGVHEAREVILSSAELLKLGQEQIDAYRRAYRLSQDRLNNHIPASTYSEVLASMLAVNLAQANYLVVVRDYDKAQLRLLVLIGRSGKTRGEGSGARGQG
jgi:outer membrane protein TolC